MSDDKLNIFEVLSKISTKDNAYYDSLPEHNKKQFAPLVVNRWLSGTNNRSQVYILNEVVNPYTFSLGYHHKSLMYKLMTICTSGKPQQHRWQAGPSKKTSSKPTCTRAIMEMYGYSEKRAIEALYILSSEEIMSYGEQLGYQADQMEKLKKECKDK
jgi:hypothetical protein